jgi:hypothetical protein
MAPKNKIYTLEEVQKHNTESDIWLVIGNDSNGKYENTLFHACDHIYVYMSYYAVSELSIIFPKHRSDNFTYVGPSQTMCLYAKFKMRISNPYMASFLLIYTKDWSVST